jgi:hypothetical protein
MKSGAKCSHKRACEILPQDCVLPNDIQSSLYQKSLNFTSKKTHFKYDHNYLPTTSPDYSFRF